MSDQIRRFQVIVASCAVMASLIAAVVTRNPVTVADHSTPMAFLSMFGIATAIVATAGRVPARLTGWSCGLAAVMAYVLYLMGISLVAWVYTLTAALAVASVVLLVMLKPRTTPQ